MSAATVEAFEADPPQVQNSNSNETLLSVTPLNDQVHNNDDDRLSKSDGPPMKTTITITTTPRSNNGNDSTLPPSATQQMTTISVMLDFDMDNTLNTMKEHKHCKKQKPENAELMEPLSIDTKSPQNMPPSTVLPPTPPTTPNLQNTARKRWRILAKVLRKDSEETVSSSGEEYGDEHTASVRRFKSFDLLRQDSFEDHMSLNCLGKPENWYKYRVLLEGSDQQEYTVNIHQLDRHLTATDLMGFNNTGNICVWPSEEALTAYVLSDLPAYNDKWILELGGGFTCLTGLMLAKYAKPFAMHLTDGNEVSVENVRKTVCLNEVACYTKCSVLKWEDVGSRVPAERGQFDVILSADCLFFDEARAALVDTIAYYLSPYGVALIMAPRRGKTMSLFIDETRVKGFVVEVIERYNDTIWQRHLELQHSELYDEDLHYPVLLRLRKPQ